MGIDREEAKKLKPLTEKEYQELKRKCEENDGYASIMGDDVERLAILSYKGDKRAKKILDCFNDEVLDKETIEQIQESWKLREKMDALLEEIKGSYKEAKEDPKLANDFIQRLEELNKLFENMNPIGFKEEKQKQERRSRKQAHEVGAISNLPKNILYPILDGYENYMSTDQEEKGAAYIIPIATAENLNFKDGKIYFENNKELTKAEIRNLQTNEAIYNIDQPLLRQLYSIILSDFHSNGMIEPKDKITVHANELAQVIGIKGSINKQNIGLMRDKLIRFHNQVGAMTIMRNGKPDESYFPLLNFEGYDAKYNTFSFSSPYINEIIKRFYPIETKRQQILRKNIKPLELPENHSNLILSSITSERNRAAVENVYIIVPLIERAAKDGNTKPFISVSEIIERNDKIRERLETTSNPTLLLQRVFKRTWELLKEKTQLTERYSNIGITTDMETITLIKDIDPKKTNGAILPTGATKDSMILYFPHEGNIN